MSIYFPVQQTVSVVL